MTSTNPRRSGLAELRFSQVGRAGRVSSRPGTSPRSYRGDADRRPVLRPAPEFQVAPDVVAGELRHPYLRHELLRSDRGLEHAAEELPRCHGPRAVRARDVDLAVEREHDCGQRSEEHTSEL